MRMNKEEMSLAMERIKEVSDRLTVNQTKALEKVVEKAHKRIDERLNLATKRLTEKTIAEIKERLEVVSNIEQITDDIRDLRRVTEDLIDRHAILTEVAYISRHRLDSAGQAKVNAELIKSMEFDADWFKTRNDMSLNELFNLYQNGVENDPKE